MDLQNTTPKLFVFYDEQLDDAKFVRSAEQLASRIGSSSTADFEELVKAPATKPLIYRYISKEALVARSELVKTQCARDCKFIVFGEVNREMKESVPVFLWRHVELFTNHIDRVCEYLSKQQPHREQGQAQQHFVMFHGQRSQEITVAYQLVRGCDREGRVSCLSEESSSSPKLLEQNKVSCVVEMQHFSKLYLLTKQLQMKCQLAFVVIADNAQPKEIEKRMADMYKQEFRVVAGRAELCNYLLEMLAGSAQAKETVVRCQDIKSIYNVGSPSTATGKYLSVVEVPELTKEHLGADNGWQLVIANEGRFAEVASILKGSWLMICDEMLINETISFSSCRKVQVLLADERIAMSLLDKLALTRHETNNQAQLVARIMKDSDQVNEATLDKLQRLVFADKQIIKLFTTKPTERFMQVLKSAASKELSNIFVYRSKCDLGRHSHRKDFVLLDEGMESRPADFSSRVLALKELPLASEGPIQIALKEVPYYLRRQNELEEAYRQYSQIIDVSRLGVYILGGSSHQWKVLAKRIRYQMHVLNVQLELVEEADPVKMCSHITRSSNDLNFLLIDHSLLRAFEKAEKSCSSSPQNLQKSVWKSPIEKFDIPQLFTHDYRFLASLTEAIRQHNRKHNQKLDYVNVRIFAFENAAISNYLQEKLHKKKVYLYKSSSELFQITSDMQKGVKEIIFMGLDAFTQDMENRIEEIYRQQMVSFEVILVSPMAYILKTFKKNKTHYCFLSQKELKEKIDGFKSLKEEDTVAEGALLEKIQDELKKQQIMPMEASPSSDNRSNSGRRSAKSGLVELSVTTDKSDTPSKESKEEPKEELEYTPSKYLGPILSVDINEDREQSSSSKEFKRQKSTTEAPTITIMPPANEQSKPSQVIVSAGQPKLQLHQGEICPATLNLRSVIMAPIQLFQPICKPTIPTVVGINHPKSSAISVAEECSEKKDRSKARSEKLFDLCSSDSKLQNREPSPIPKIEETNKTHGEQAILEQLESKESTDKLQREPLRRPTKRTSSEKSSKLAVKFVQIKPRNQPSEGSVHSLAKINLEDVTKMRKKLSEKRLQPTKLKKPQHPCRGEYLIEPKQMLTSAQQLQETQRTSSSSVRKMTSCYSAQKITNFRILKSRSPKPMSEASDKHCRPSSAFRTSVRPLSEDDDVDDPFERFRQYHSELKLKLAQKSRLTFFLPINQEQLCKNLKCRLSKSSKAAVKGYLDVGDIEKQRDPSHHSIIVVDDIAHFRELDDVTWFVVKCRERMAAASNVYYFPNLPYTEEFIASLFLLQQEESIADPRKSAQKRIYVLYKGSSSVLAEIARSCEKIGECKVKAYKSGSLGLCISGIGINNDILLLTSSSNYDEEAYAVYSLRKNIEIVECSGNAGTEKDLDSGPLARRVRTLLNDRNEQQTKPNTARSCFHIK